MTALDAELMGNTPRTCADAAELATPAVAPLPSSRLHRCVITPPGPTLHCTEQTAAIDSSRFGRSHAEYHGERANRMP
jgi:hypothetical protein